MFFKAQRSFKIGTGGSEKKVNVSLKYLKSGAYGAA